MKRLKMFWMLVIIGTMATVWVGSAVLAALILPERNPTTQHYGSILNPEADELLRQSCFDCHSNETRWPAYTHLPVINVFMADHVEEGRRELNFSLWNQFSESRRRKILSESIEVVEEGEMPLFPYTLTHPKADLSPNQIALLKQGIVQQYGASAIEEHGEGHGKEHDDDDND